MRTGLVVTGVILLVFGVFVGIGGGAVLGVGEAAGGADCGSGVFRDPDCQRETQSASAMFATLGMAMVSGGVIFGLAGVGLLVAGLVMAPKAVPVPVTAPAPAATTVMRPCPACSAPALAEAKVCPSCGAAIAPMKLRLTP